MTPLDVRGVSAGYAPGHPVLTDVTFQAEEGQAIGVLGPNGGGKTTLFRVLRDELTPLTGVVERTESLASVPQGDTARLDFPVSARDVALMGAYARTPWFRRIAAQDRRRADEALDRVGLADRAGTRFGALSGGQRRRTLIARALVQDAQTLLLDEPFAGVDQHSEQTILQVLDDLTNEGRTLLIATHDLEQARRWDRVLCLNGRQTAFGPPQDVLAPTTLEQTYATELIVLDGERLAAAPHHDCGDHA